LKQETFHKTTGPTTLFSPPSGPVSREYLNSSFSGAIVPLPFYNKDQRVPSLMIEINRRLLMDENTGEKLPRIDMVFQKTGEILEKVIDYWACSI